MSRLLFDEAANLWYSALVLDLMTGIGSVVFSLVDSLQRWSIYGALGVSVLAVIAYGLKTLAEDKHALAEEMRRYSVLMEALAWSPKKTQLDTWSQKTGWQIRSAVQDEPREPGYYSSEREQGAGRLAEMTLESAFYTYHVYIRLKRWAGWVALIFMMLLLLLLIVSAMQIMPLPFASSFTTAVFLLIPVMLAINFVGLWRKLGQIAESIFIIVGSLDSLLEAPKSDVTHVMQQVSEYNCQLAQGVPVLTWFFKRWHDEISDLWDQR